MYLVVGASMIVGTRCMYYRGVCEHEHRHEMHVSGGGCEQTELLPSLSKGDRSAALRCVGEVGGERAAARCVRGGGGGGSSLVCQWVGG